MKVYHAARDHLLKSIEKNLRHVDDSIVRALLDLLERAVSEGKRIFLMGAGRSGLVAKAAGMRLVHLGFEAYIVGETITKPLRKGDVFIAISGSGETTSVVSVATKAKGLGGKVVAITSNPSSTLGRLADIIIKLESKREDDMEHNYYARQIESSKAALSPMGTLFELSAMIFFDSIMGELSSRLQMDEEDMKKRHTNIE